MACRGCAGSDGCACSVVGSGDGVITMAGTGTPVTSPYTPSFHGDVWMDGLTETTVDALTSPKVPVVDSLGNEYKVPFTDVTSVTGEPGGSSFRFTFSATTTDSDPGDGIVRFNNATLASVTQIYIDTEEVGGTNITDWIDSFGASGRIRAYLVSDPTVWADFTLTSVTSATGYRKLNVTHVDSNGIFTTDIGDLVITYGSPGGTGPTGPAGAPGGASFRYTYSVTTTDADPGSGTLRLNNGTYSSVTQIYIDLLETGATDVTTWLDSLDNSTNGVKGLIKLSSHSDQTKWITFELTSITTATGYRKLNVNYVDHNGTLTTTSGDTIFSFSRAGDQGAAGSVQTVSQQTTNYTLVLGDAEDLIRVGSAGNMDVTIPPNSSVAFPIGTHIDFWLEGANTVTFVPDTGVTIQSEGGLLNIATQYTAASLIKLATNTWALIGKLS